MFSLLTYRGFSPFIIVFCLFFYLFLISLTCQSGSRWDVKLYLKPVLPIRCVTLCHLGKLSKLRIGIS